MRRFALFLLLSMTACAASSGVKTGEGEPCGAVTCDDGLVCCNASCGICTEPGATCTTVACEPPPTCEAMDATGVGGCEMMLGWLFDGEACLPLSGCSCEGADCDALFETAGDCELECVAREDGASCGGFTGAECDPGSYCDYEDGSGCMGAGFCKSFSPESCVGVPAEVCGCDGTTYPSACAAYGAGTDVASSGPCDAP